MVEDPFAETREELFLAAAEMQGMVLRAYEPKITEAAARGNVHRVAELTHQCHREIHLATAPFTKALCNLPPIPMVFTGH